MSETPEVPGDYTAAETADGLPRDTLKQVTGEDAEPIPGPEPEAPEASEPDVTTTTETTTETEVTTDDAQDD